MSGMNEDGNEIIHTDQEIKVKDIEKVNEVHIGENNEKTLVSVNTDSYDGNNLKSSILKDDENLSRRLEERDKNVTVNGSVENEEGSDSEDVSLFGDKYAGRTSQIPDFAVVYSFFHMFGVLLDLPYVTISDLEQSIDSTKDLAKKADQGILELLHIKLFRKLNKSTRFASLANLQTNKLTKTVLKFVQMLELDCAWDLEQFGYHMLGGAERLLILKHLCEIQFDENPKFRNNLQDAYKTEQVATLRLPPYGYEQDGLHVWLHEDKDLNVRIYAGEEDDVSGDTWKVRAGSLEDLEVYISKLKQLSEVNPKDIAAEKIRERRAVKQEKRERERKEREQKKEEEEEKQTQKKGKGRRSKQKKEEVIEESSDDEDDGCARCFKINQSDLVLLCDGCDAAYHTLCLRPPVMVIPDGDWYCPFCLQLKLIEKLQQKCNELKTKLRARERKSKRLDFYGIHSVNILDQSSDDGLSRRSGRAARKVDYNFSDYDQMINEAVASYKKKGSKNDSNGSEHEKPTRQSKRDKSSYRRKLNALSSDESDNICDSDYMMSESDGDNRRDDFNDFLVDDDFDEIEEKHRMKYLRRSKRNRDKRIPGLRKRYRDDDGDDSNNEDIPSDSDDGFGPRRSRRQKKVALYREHYSDESDTNTNTKWEDDGGNWERKPDEEEEVTEEEIESDHDGKNNGLSESEAIESDCLTTPRHKEKGSGLKHKKKINVIESDEDEDAHVSYNDESEDEKNGGVAEEKEREEEKEEEEKDEERSKKNIDESDELETTEARDDNDLKAVVQQYNASNGGVKDSGTDGQKPVEGNINTAIDDIKTTAVSSCFEPVTNTPTISTSGVEKSEQTEEKKLPVSYNSHTIQQIQIHHPKPMHPRDLMNSTLPGSNCNAFRSTLGHNSATQTTQNVSNWTNSAHDVTQSTVDTLMSEAKLPPEYSQAETSRRDAPRYAAAPSYYSTHYPRPYHSPEYSMQPSQGISSPASLPMRPTPAYPYDVAHSGGDHSPSYSPHHSPSYSPQHWPGRRHPPPNYYQSFHRPPSVPTEKFYSSHHGWQQQDWNYPQPPGPYGNPANNHKFSGENEKQQKKQMKEQAKQERDMKKLQKIREKEQKKNTKLPHSQSVCHGVPGNPTNSMNFFKNMVISADGGRKQSNEAAAASYTPFTPTRL